MNVDTGRVEAPWWNDRPVAIVGAGPSLAGIDYERFRGPWRVLAVASALWRIPWADAAYDQDSVWLRVHEARLRAVKRTTLYLCWPPSQSRHECPQIDNAIWIEGQRGDGSVSTRPDRVEVGFTSGQGSLSIACLKRARRVVLFGFDYREHGRQQHAHNEDYPWHLPPGMLDRQWPVWARKFDMARPSLDRAGVRVLNASPDSAIAAFDRCSIEDGLRALEPAGVN